MNIMSSFTGWVNLGEVSDKFTVIVIWTTADFEHLKVFFLYFMLSS